MLNANKLRGAIAGNGYRLQDVAAKMGIANNTLTRKMRSGVFLSNEINVLRELLHLNTNELVDIFFAEDVAYDATNDAKEGENQ